MSDYDIESLSQGRVVCVGDFMLDRYVEGTVSRLSPEAPIPVLEVGGDSEVLGGAGNVVANLHDVGAVIYSIGVVGDDDAGMRIESLLQSFGGDHKLLKIAGRKSTSKTRFRSKNQQILRVDEEERTELGTQAQQRLCRALETALQKADVLVLSDYGKGVLLGTTAKKMISIAKSAGVPVIVDPKGYSMEKYAGADYITPNRKELLEATGLACEDIPDIVTAARKLIHDHNIANVLATLSENGMVLVDREHYTHFSDVEKEVYDVGGAGDTVVAIFSAGLAAGLDALKSAYLSNIAAGIVVGKSGTASVTLHEIRAATHKPHHAGRACVVGEDLLTKRVQEWRDRGLTVGFANGCFDIIHAGHIQLLSEARAQCDRLIVAVNSDASVCNLKGEGRPVHQLEDRMHLLANLKTVDGLISFDAPTPIKVISQLKPDILFKGGDYQAQDVVGFQELKAWGGRVEIIPLKEGYSTTKIIEEAGKWVTKG